MVRREKIDIMQKESNKHPSMKTFEIRRTRKETKKACIELI